MPFLEKSDFKNLTDAWMKVRYVLEFKLVWGYYNISKKWFQFHFVL